MEPNKDGFQRDRAKWAIVLQIYHWLSWVTYLSVIWDAMTLIWQHSFPQDCHLQEQSRSYYASNRELLNDAAYDIYQPLIVDATVKRMSKTEEPINLLDKLSMGCFVDYPDDRDLSYHMFTSGSDMTIEKCQTACRQQAFKYSGLQVHKQPNNTVERELSLCQPCHHWLHQRLLWCTSFRPENCVSHFEDTICKYIQLKICIFKCAYSNFTALFLSWGSEGNGPALLAITAHQTCIVSWRMFFTGYIQTPYACHIHFVSFINFIFIVSIYILYFIPWSIDNFVRILCYEQVRRYFNKGVHVKYFPITIVDLLAEWHGMLL